jgi:uncharacterized membrane protein YdjX (TVP38/TMEM64 family)
MRLTRRGATVALLFALVGVALTFQGAHVALLRILARAEAIASGHPTAAAALVVFVAALGAMLVFVSSWVIVPFAIFTWGPSRTLLLLWGGWLLGGALSYAIGRVLGRPVVRALIPPAQLARYETRITPRSAFGLVLLLQLALPSEIPGYLLGLVRYPVGWYLLSLGVTALLHGVATVYLGAGVVQRQVLPIAGVAAALALITAAAAFAVRRHLRIAHHEAGAATPQPVSDAPLLA